MAAASCTMWPFSPREVASSLTVGFFVASQLVRGELEYLQQDMWWWNAEPGGPVHAAGPLQIRAGLEQPVPPAGPLQPTSLPHPELPSHMEHRALGRGNLGRIGVEGGSWAPHVEYRAGFSPGLAESVAWIPQQGLIHFAGS